MSRQETKIKFYYFLTDLIIYQYFSNRKIRVLLCMVADKRIFALISSQKRWHLDDPLMVFIGIHQPNLRINSRIGRRRRRRRRQASKGISDGRGRRKSEHSNEISIQTLHFTRETPSDLSRLFPLFLRVGICRVSFIHSALQLAVRQGWRR